MIATQQKAITFVRVLNGKGFDGWNKNYSSAGRIVLIKVSCWTLIWGQKSHVRQKCFIQDVSKFNKKNETDDSQHNFNTKTPYGCFELNAFVSEIQGDKSPTVFEILIWNLLVMFFKCIGSNVTFSVQGVFYKKIFVGLAYIFYIQFLCVYGINIF